MAKEVYRNTIHHDMLDELSAKIIGLIRLPCLIVLDGEMGTGKTELVRSLGNVLGFADQVSSPSYCLENEYTSSSSSYFNGIDVTIFHWDCYRMNQGDFEEYQIHEELSQSNAFVIIEWASRLPDIEKMANLKISINFSPNGDDFREFIISKYESKKQ